MRSSVVYGHSGLLFGLLGVIIALLGLQTAVLSGNAGLSALFALGAWIVGVIFLLAEAIAVDRPDRP